MYWVNVARYEIGRRVNNFETSVHLFMSNHLVKCIHLDLLQLHNIKAKFKRVSCIKWWIQNISEPLYYTILDLNIVKRIYENLKVYVHFCRRLYIQIQNCSYHNHLHSLQSTVQTQSDCENASNLSTASAGQSMRGNQPDRARLSPWQIDTENLETGRTIVARLGCTTKLIRTYLQLYIPRIKLKTRYKTAHPIFKDTKIPVKIHLILIS